MKLEIQGPHRTRGTKRDAWAVFAAGNGKDAIATLPDAVRRIARGAVPAQIAAEGALFTMPLGENAPARRLYVFGAGKSRDLSPRKVRGIIRNAVRALNRNGERTALIDLPFTIQRMSAAEGREFVLRTLRLADYAFRPYKSADPDKRTLNSIAVSLDGGPFSGVSPREASREAREAEIIARAGSLMRDLGNTPSNDLPPRAFAERARKEARSRGVTVRILDKRAIERERMGGLLAVSRGSQEEPRLVVAEWDGARNGGRPVALVGKGITFDSGGISIKPAEKMGDMKWDMMGAATALAVVLAAADLKLPVHVVGIMPLAENLPSGSAYKPGDIVRFRNGKTAEIDNTDAEGRVVLADALDYARRWKPGVILDYATLTGAALVALGLEAAIVFSDDDALAAELLSAGERTDERLWRLPMWDDYRENIRSEWADFKNTGGRYGGSINGALFLKEFVDPATPWAHLDIAGTAYFERDHAGYGLGATGFGLALTLRWLRDRLQAKQQ